ncbi:MAG TPA: polysaccharide deacetylase family protein [Syntrophomonadaceae bacterium]|nr:polysaccharide deacetylase family protein [Syntrophomonadaceae bacterium]
MTRRQEYFCALAIFLVNFLVSFTIWTYSTPNHYPTPSSLFSLETAVAQTAPPAQASQAEAAPVIAQAPLSIAPVQPATPTTVDQTIAVPILMYHKINPYSSGGLYRITPDEFDWQMQYLHDNGYHTISIDAVLDYFQQGQKLPEKPIVITLDDGYRDNYLYAFPILQKYGFTATLFVITNTVAPANVDNNMLTWDQIREMANSGITIGCHTLDHEHLTRVDLAEAQRQIADSKNVLEQELGKKIEIFSYPYGEHNQSVEKLVQESGFRAATTVNPEPVTNADDPFALNRIGIYSNLDHQGFIDKVNRYYT